MKVLLFLYVCPQVVLLGKSNITLFALRFTVGHIGGDTFEAVKEEPGYGGFVVSISVSYGCVYKEQYSGASTQVLLFVHACSQVVLLDKYNIALFASGFSFGPIRGRYQSRRNNMLSTLLWRFCCFYLCVS